MRRGWKLVQHLLKMTLASSEKCNYDEDTDMPIAWREDRLPVD